MKMNLKFKSTILLLLLSISCFAQEYAGKGEDINIILKNINEFSRLYVGAETDKLTAMYCEDAKIFPAGDDIIIGQTAIKNKWTLPKGAKVLSHKVTPKEIKIIEDYAYDYGYYEGSSINKDDVTSNWKGKYVIIWKKEDNNWKIYLDIWNRINERK